MSLFATSYKVHDLNLFGTHRCMLDLGYSLDNSTVFWPGGEGHHSYLLFVVDKKDY